MILILKSLLTPLREKLFRVKEGVVEETLAQGGAEKAGLKPPVRNPFKSTIVRAVEIVQAMDEMVSILRERERSSSETKVPPEHESSVNRGF